MPYQETEIEGVFLFTPNVFGDSRGDFYESFRSDQIIVETGFEFQVAQVNNSVSSKGVLRGIHFKENPPGQQKFVSVTSGAIIDVAIDLRRSSPTFRKWQAFELNEENRLSLLIGNGIGHAFLSLQDKTKVTYLCDSVFEPEKEHGISPLSAGIDWEQFASRFGKSELLLSDKDRNAPKLDEAERLLFP
jgi:dTDP-4-dehydrorhamnose 3,5-epimerase